MFFLINVLGSGAEARVGEIHIQRSSASRQWQRAPRAYSIKPRRPKNGWRWVAKKVTSTWKRTAKCTENPRGPHNNKRHRRQDARAPFELRLPHLPPWTWRSIKRLQMFFVNGQDRREEKHYRLIAEHPSLPRPTFVEWLRSGGGSVIRRLRPYKIR
jgi:hypothetical protein